MHHPLPLLLLAFLTAPAAEPPPPFHYAHSLFEDASAEGCGSCHVPLLVLRASLAGAAARRMAVIGTYERDSIWRLRPAPQSVQPPQGDDALMRTLEWDGRRYRYQPVSNDGVVHLLREPEGRIPIHRPQAPVGADARALRSTLLHDPGPDHAP